jgi:transcription antitermination factor NusG
VSAILFETEGPTEIAWHAVYTRHQHEKAVAGLLETKGVEVFLPLFASSRHWSDRNKMLWLPLFPGYVFFRGGSDCRLKIVGTPGVHMILSNGARPALISESEIAAIRKVVAGPYPIAPHPFLLCGERVRIKRGALEGIEGVLLRQKNQCRLVISVDMLAQAVAVEIDASEVERSPAIRSARVLPQESRCGQSLNPPAYQRLVGPIPQESKL